MFLMVYIMGSQLLIVDFSFYHIILSFNSVWDRNIQIFCHPSCITNSSWSEIIIILSVWIDIICDLPLVLAAGKSLKMLLENAWIWWWMLERWSRLRTKTTDKILRLFFNMILTLFLFGIPILFVTYIPSKNKLQSGGLFPLSLSFLQTGSRHV